MNGNQKIEEYLDRASKAYYNGTPFISDEEFDYLADKAGYNKVGYKSTKNKQKHLYRMYSLQKFYVGDKLPEYKDAVSTDKLDGAAISLIYVDGILVQATTRGDGFEGESIIEHVKYIPSIPTQTKLVEIKQITGEVVAPKEIDNSRNYVSGALHLKDPKEVANRDLHFIAYGIFPAPFLSYSFNMSRLVANGFDTVLDEEWSHKYKTDGIVVRERSEDIYQGWGFTSKHPKGAYALKKASDVVTLPTKLLDVRWQMGPSGKVTPVAIFESIVIDGATISKATLHNAGFIEDLDLHIGDTLLITRRGGIIPYVTGKA